MKKVKELLKKPAVAWAVAIVTMSLFAKLGIEMSPELARAINILIMAYTGA